MAARTLSLKYHPSQTAKGAHPLHTNTTIARILVADDDIISRTLVCHLLANAGHKVIEACDGEQSLAASLQSPAPDVAVLDHRMPRLTGLQVARQIAGRIPFIMMSTEDAARVECRRLGGLTDGYGAAQSGVKRRSPVQ